MNSSPIVRLTNIVKTFKSPGGIVNALRDVSLEVRRGEVLGIVGPNGAGKSTLLRIIAGLIVPDGGEIVWSGYNKERRPIFIGSSERGFYYRLSGIDNLRFFLKLAGQEFDEDGGEFRSLVNRFELETVIGRRYQTYSTGERQRFALLYAIMAKPSLFIIDEFTHSVDILSQSGLASLVREYVNENSGAIIATHQIGIVREACHRVAFINNGCIVAVGMPQEISRVYFKGDEFRLILDGTTADVTDIENVEIIGIEKVGGRAIVDVRFEGGLPELIITVERKGVRVLSAMNIGEDIGEAYRRAIERDVE